MSMFGNIAIEGELEKLLKLIEEASNDGKSAEDVLSMLEMEIKADLKAAKSGYL